MIYLKTGTGDLWMPKVSSATPKNCKKDGFSPTTTAISVTPTRDLSAVTSKSATQVATTTTKVSKLTAEQEQVYQYQQKHATVITAEQQQTHQMSVIMKMPTATAAASSPTASGTIVSPIPRASKRNSPEKSERILLGGHYTTPPQPGKEYRESADDRDSDWDARRQMLSPTTTAAAISASGTIVSPIPRASMPNSPAGSNNSSPHREKSERILLGGHYTTPPQPGKEYRESGDDRDSDWDARRQMLSPTTAISGITTITPLHKTIATIPKQRSAYSPVKNASSAAAKESVSAHTNQLVSEQRGSTTTRLTGTTGTAALRAELQSTAGGDGGGGGSVSAYGIDDDTNTPYNISAVGADSGHGDGEEGMVDEKQENETTTYRATAAESGGEVHTTTGRQIPSTMSGSPTRANVSVSSPLSPKLVAAQAAQSQQSQQFHSKNERERTYTEQRGASTSSSAGFNSNTNTITKVQTQENTTISNNRHYNASTSSYSPSNYAIPQQQNNSGGSGKIFSKLHNNQFIKNQQQQHQQLQQTGTQPSTATQSNITARYLKYKSQAAHAQESGNGSETGSTSTNYSGSPTKSFVAPTASAIKKKMVAVQEMKKTTQPSGNHGQLHSHRTHHNHQQMISAGGGGTCARTALSGGRAQPPNQTDDVNFDPAEDLSYGPGIVSKLRCRYLSLAFRESMEKERHCLDNMRRATSLNNLLDREEPHDDDEPEDDLDSGGAVDVETHEVEEYVELLADADRTLNNERKLKTQGGILKHSGDAVTQDNTKKTTTFQKNANAFAANGTRLLNSAPVGSAGGAVSSANVATPDTPRSRHVKRGNDSLKRARSVEALLCERSPWQYTALNRTSYQPQHFTSGGSQTYATTQPTCVTIEDKINNARSRLILGTDIMPPKRLTSVIDDTERPPPDLVKQTLKKFEATANRRGRGPNRTNGTGEVASKVATYKTIIKENKPAIVFPKPPLSPTKKLNSPLLTKPLAKPVVGANDLLNSPLGRKTTAAAAVNAPAVVTGKTQAATSNHGAASAVASGLSENSPDIIPRHKLLTEKSETLLHGVADSPVTALTKKLEKLRIDAADKQQQQQQQLQTIPTKEAKQPAQLNKQSQHSALVVSSSDNEFVHSSELNNDNNASNSSQLVGGAEEGEAAADSDAALEGNENGNNNKHTAASTKQHTDRAGTGTGISASGESAVEPDTAQAGTAAISSDLSDDDDGLIGIAAAAPTKRITRTALDNIARAGTTQQFKFAGSGQTNIGSKATVELTKSKPQTNLNPDIPTSVLNAAPGKQIGVIRPLPTTTAAQQAANANTTNSAFSHQQQLLQQHLEALKQNNVYNNTSSTPTSATNATATHSSIYHSTPPLTSREIEKNRINEMKKTVALADGSPITATMVNASNNATTPAAQHAANASLNTVINTNAPGHKSNNAGATSSTAPIVGGSSGTSGFNELDAAAQGANNSPLWALRIKRQTPSVAQENTSMVFNFSNRKEVPDYIENDGVIFRRKRELPKPNESGFVLLGDLSLETSTDSDYDDFSMCPPSPCDVEFENANIVIDGKSSIRQKSKEATFRVQFNDTLTSTFEYPSEASLIIDDSYSNDALIGAYENVSLNDTTDSSPARHHHVAVDEIIQLPTPANTSSPANNASSATNTPTKNILGNLPLDYPILDKGIMSQQQQQQQQQPPQQQQLEQPLIVKKPQNAVSVAAPAALLSEEPLQSNLVETTLLLQTQHEIACNASQQPTRSPPHVENSDKRDAPVQTCAAAAHLPPPPLTLPQRPTDLPLPMLLTTLPQQKSKSAQPQPRPVAQQKPPLPVKRLFQHTHAAPTATKVEASPASALPQFKLQAQMKQQKDIETLTETIKNEAEQTTAVGSSKREKTSKKHASGFWQRQPIVNVAQQQQAQQKLELETNKSAVRPAASPIAFDVRGATQPSLLRDFQLASANACENNCKKITTNALNPNNTAANGGATRHNTNNLAFDNKSNITTTTKKPISKYTMFHTLFETSPTEEAAANTSAQRPRKTPAVLNKPQYARFLQIEHAAATAPAAGPAILRTRSNEFHCGSVIHAKQRDANPATSQLMSATGTPQQRSASFSFGNNAGERTECAAAKVCPPPTPTSVVARNSKQSAATTVNKCKKELLKSVGNSLNRNSTDDECFEDAIDYIYPIPTITLAAASCYENTNNAKAYSIQYTASQHGTPTATTITTNIKSSASSVALPSTLHTRTVCTNTTTSTIAPITTTTTTTTLISNTCTQTTLNQQTITSNQTTNTSLTSSSSHTSTSSTTFYSYSSFSAANCTRHNSFADANINYKTAGNAQHSAVNYLRPSPFKANKNLCNNNASANASKSRVNYNSASANLPPPPAAAGALISPFSLPVASTTLLRSRIPGNTLYYV
ncbi:serine-rich adhesin for platelets isoform X2 [Bactrocera oleae]|uniref:serine-rich adhesin for platelets isoform X2 n=1 Tax=Bactrocera oleae TaxID=104688 RepID=UPI00387E6A65